MDENKIYNETELKEIFDQIWTGRFPANIDKIKDLVLNNLEHYTSKERNNKIVKDIFWNTIHIISYLNDESNFINATKLSYCLKRFISVENLGLTDYLRFVSTHAHLLYVTNDYKRLNSFLGIFFNYINSNRKHLKNIIKDNLDESEILRNNYLLFLRQIISIYSFAGATANTFGLLSKTGYYYYWKKYFEGILYLNCAYLSSDDEIIRRADYFSLSYRIDDVTIESDLNKIRKLHTYFKGIINKFLLITTGNGEKPYRVILTMTATILTYSFLYHTLQITNTNNYLHNLFFSLFAFTSFGLYQPFENNTITPTDNYWSMIIFASEIILGIVLNGIFIVSLSRKIMR